MLKNMRNFALNPKGVPERMRKVLEASRTNGLPEKELQQYFRAMVTDTEREDIAIANYQDGYDAGMEKGKAKGAEDTARRMLADHKPLAEIVKYSGLSEEQVRALMPSARR